MKDYYKILGITPEADEDELKQSFRRAALKFHPDQNKSTEATEKFIEATEAYEILSDPEKRNTYDEYRSQRRNWAASDLPTGDWKNEARAKGRLFARMSFEELLAKISSAADTARFHGGHFARIGFLSYLAFGVAIEAVVFGVIVMSSTVLGGLLLFGIAFLSTKWGLRRIREEKERYSQAREDRSG